MPTIATIFSGGEGVGIGAQNAGYTHLWGIELVDKIAQVARDNGFNTITGDVFDIAPATLQKPDVLHASPECQRASIANAKRGETELDILLGKRVEDYITALLPKIFTLENVRPYRHFQAFKSIVNKLFELGYMVDYENVCAADFGVPQTRRRLILRASRIGLLPILPPKEKWIGWYEAIEDLIPTLPESQFADWQIKRLQAAIDKEQKLNDSLFIGGANKSQSFLDFAIENRPTIPGIKNQSEPMNTVPSDYATIQAGRAFLVEGRTGGDRPIQTKSKTEPSMTINTSSGGNVVRAFIVDDKQGKRLADGTRTVATRQEHKPIFTIQTSHPLRAWLSQGRIVSMTPRALARFQTFPDWYKLPPTKTLACKVIGNAVPCLMYEKIIKQFLPFL